MVERDELDAFRAELLRQKIIFEAELRRQRDVFDERLDMFARALSDRETDCRNLQSVVTILGHKLDQVHEHLARLNAAPPRESRARSPLSSGGGNSAPPSALDRSRGGSASNTPVKARVGSPIRGRETVRLTSFSVSTPRLARPDSPSRNGTVVATATRPKLLGSQAQRVQNTSSPVVRWGARGTVPPFKP